MKVLHGILLNRNIQKAPDHQIGSFLRCFRKILLLQRQQQAAAIPTIGRGGSAYRIQLLQPSLWDANKVGCVAYVNP